MDLTSAESDADVAKLPSFKAMSEFAVKDEKVKRQLMKERKEAAQAEFSQEEWRSAMELGELAGMKKTDVETVKSFLSRVDDKYRASYGLNVESHPRRA